MTDTSTLTDWSKTDDVIALANWLDAQPIPDSTQDLPFAPHDIDLNNITARAASGLLAVYRQQDDGEKIRALIRHLLQKDELNNETFKQLINELERHDDRERQASIQQLEQKKQSSIKTAPAGAVALPSSPYFAPFTSGEGDFGVVFAVEIVAAQATRATPPIDEACADLLIALHHASDHAADQYGLGVDVRLAWRFISQNQSLTIALIIRVCGLEDATTAAQIAGLLWHTIDGLLPLNRTFFVYRPVVDVKRLDWLRQPDKVVSAFAITRQERQIEHEGREIYAVDLVGGGTGNRQPLIAEMMRQPGLSIVDIQLTPARWQRNERETIRDMLRAEWSDSQLEQVDILMMRLTDNRYQRAVATYQHSLSREMMFMTRVTIASSEPMASTGLPMVAALNLFGTSHYEIRPIPVSTEQETVTGHLLHLSGLDSPRPNAPAGLERILHLWTPEEALAAVRLPMPGSSGLPGVPVQQIKITTLPQGLFKEGLLLGDAYDPTLNLIQPIHFGLAERSRHAYIVGRTGTGKTTLLENMALQDIYAGRGVGVIDPHGDLIEAILARIPPERARDVVLFDPAADERPVGLNILDVEGEFERNMVISEFMGLLYSIYDPGRTGIVGPRFEQAVRNAMHTAMAIQGSTLIDVMRILSNEKYVKACLKFVSDPLVKAYYKDIVDGQSSFHKSEVLDYITSKFGRFTGDTAIRNVVGQSKTTINFEQIMDDGKILLVNLAKGRIGQENSRFLGLLLVPRILIAAFSRAKQSATQRRSFYLYIDEFHNFTTPMLSTMLSEGRKYGLSLTLANQFTSQLTNDVREAVFGNVGTLGVFQVGVKDALFLAQELYPVFDGDDLINLPAFHMALKMPLGGVSGRPFMLKTRPSNDNADASMAEAVRHNALLHYGRDRIVIDAEIRHRFDTPPQPKA